MDKNLSKKSFSIESLLSAESPGSSSENKPTTPPLFSMPSSWLRPTMISPRESFHRVPLIDPSYGLFYAGFPQMTSSSFFPTSPSISSEARMRIFQPNLAGACSKSFTTRNKVEHKVATQGSTQSPSHCNNSEMDLHEPDKRRRTNFSVNQIDQLEASFTKHQYPNSKERAQMSEKLGIKEESIKIWFQNRRTRWKKLQNERSRSSTSESSVHQPHSFARLQELATSSKFQ